MSLFSATALALSLSADAFAVSLSKGASMARPRLRDAFYIGSIFALTEMVMPLIGWLFGLLASNLIESVDHWIAFFLLFLIGSHMIYTGTQPTTPPQATARRTPPPLGLLFLTAFATSIDALAVGVTLAFLDMDIFVSVLLIGLVTLIMATGGILTGQYLGKRAGRYAEIAGGLLLISIGIKTLCEHLGFF